MHKLRKENICQEYSMRGIARVLGHYDIIFPNYNEIRNEICRLYNFYYGDNKEKIERIANKMHMNEKQVTAILHSKDVCDYLKYKEE